MQLRSCDISEVISFELCGYNIIIVPHEYEERLKKEDNFWY